MKCPSKILGMAIVCCWFMSCITEGSVRRELSVVPEKKLEFRDNFIQNQEENKRFSIAIIPDSQGYCHYAPQHFSFLSYPESYCEIFYRQTKFIAEHSIQNGGDFSFAIHVGDLIHDAMKLKGEWLMADLCMKNLKDQIPFLVVPGNHDYDKKLSKSTTIDGSAAYNSYFGPDSEYFKGKKWYGGSSAEGRNSYATFEACGYKFLVLGLEIDPSDTSLEWAQDVIDQHKGWPTIYVTREFLHATRRKDGEKWKNARYVNDDSRKDLPHNSPLDQWKKFISKNDQIFMVVCGHSSLKDCGSALRVDKNANGNTTYSILSDYQDADTYMERNGYHPSVNIFCGDGWMTILDFDLDKKNIHLSTYSTEFDEYRYDNYADLDLPINWDWDKRFVLVE